MKKYVLAFTLLLALIFPKNSFADIFYFWRERTHATDCTALTDGKSSDLCFQESDSTLYKCEPTSGSTCDIPEEWVQVLSPSEVLALDELNPPSDITTLNSTTLAHGLLPKLDGDPTHFLNGQGSWATPAGGGGTGGSVSDEAFGVTWDTVTDTAPSKNAIYDYLSGLSGGGTVSDAAYDATTWDGVTNVAPSKNAVRDVIESLGSISNIKITPQSGSNNGSIYVGNNVLRSDASPTTSANVGVGNLALKNDTSGTKNTALGTAACGGLTDSSWNVCIGDHAGSGPMSGGSVKNTFVGANSGEVISSGSLNTSVGYHSMVDVTTGGTNTSVGVDSMHAMITGGSNSSLGYFAMEANTSGSSNTSIGSNTMRVMTSGSQNVAFGSYAGGGNIGGDGNIWIGYQAGYQNSYLYSANTIILGNQVAVSNSNTMVIGNSSNTNLTVNGSGGSGRTAGQNISFPSGATKGIGVSRNSTANTSGNDFKVMAGGASLTGVATISQTPTAGGSGYVLGDILTITGGDGTAQVWVSAVSGGVVTQVTAYNTGSGYSVASGIATTGGTGTGCTVSITAVTTTTDKNGGSMIIQGGMTKGTGTSNILLQVPAKGTSGTADNTQTTFATIDYNGFRTTAPSTQTIAGGDTVNADGCGGMKLISSAGTVTTSTSNTFTAPASSNSSCVMHVCNGGTNQITLDNNSNFKSTGGADVVLDANSCVEVGSTGTSGKWFQLAPVQANA